MVPKAWRFLKSCWSSVYLWWKPWNTGSDISERSSNSSSLNSLGPEREGQMNNMWIIFLLPYPFYSWLPEGTIHLWGDHPTSNEEIKTVPQLSFLIQMIPFCGKLTFQPAITTYKFSSWFFKGILIYFLRISYISKIISWLLMVHGYCKTLQTSVAFFLCGIHVLFTFVYFITFFWIIEHDKIDN